MGAETALVVFGGNVVPMAVFSSCCTTGLIESRCSGCGAWLAGAFLISRRSAARRLLRCAMKLPASFSVHK
jgi:hypothetical protein